LHRSLILSLSIAIAVGCSEPEGGLPGRLGDRSLLLNAIRASDQIEPSGRIVHLSHVCDLQVDGGTLHVVDLRQLFGEGSSPRGLNQIVVVDTELHVIRALEYANARPLQCRGADVLLFGDVSIDNLGPEGNVLTFSNGGQAVEVTGQIEAADLPAASGARPTGR
jgi:hypothetical protein